MTTREILDVDSLAENTSPAFRRALVLTADRLGVTPGALASVMRFETAGTYAPDQQSGLPLGAQFNPSRGTGLIQFMPSTAKNLGTTTAELWNMTAIEQLPFVESYLRPAAGALHSVSDLYMAVFAPIGIGQPDSFELYSKFADTAKKRARYFQNSALDASGDGTITKAEASRPVVGIFNAAKERAPLLVEMDGPGPELGRGAERLPEQGSDFGAIVVLTLLGLAMAKGLGS